MSIVENFQEKSFSSEINWQNQTNFLSSDGNLHDTSDPELPNDEKQVETENIPSDELENIIHECNEALKELTEARMRLETQLEESKKIYKDSFDATALDEEIEEENAEADQNESDTENLSLDMDFVNEQSKEMEDYETSSEGLALRSLTDNLETLQAEIDAMIEDLKKDEESVILTINDFLDRCDSKGDNDNDSSKQNCQE